MTGRAHLRRAATASAAVLLLLPAAAAAQTATGEGTIPPPPSDAQCQQVRAERSSPTIESPLPRPGAPRVFAMQFKQEIRHVETYATFRTKIECMIRERVVPQLASGRPNVVAFDEDVGLMTIATGTRGAAARRVVGNPDAPGCEGVGAPCATAAALGLVSTGYGRELAAYRARFPALNPVSGTFVAATDTFARGWMQTFSDMARRYGIYILGSNNQAPFRESSDPDDIEAFADPDEPRPASVFVATDAAVYNEVFMWGPDDVDPAAPRPMRNVVARNKKVPLTQIEELIQLTPGPSTGPAAVENVRPYALPGTDARIAFATSLPAFVYGELPAGVDPCSDTSRWYMRCLDRLGANLVIQDEANPGRWGAYTSEDSPDRGAWQPLGFMSSTWRAVTDERVGFVYNVVPHMVGNLADLAFDGQSVITQRGLGSVTSARCHYVGNSRSFPEDPETFEIGGETQDVSRYAGPKREFLALAPWVAGDGPRERLQDVAARLAPGSGDPLENDYLETAIVADLPFPAVAARPSCAGAAGTAPRSRGLRLRVRPRVSVAGARTRFRFRLTGERASSRPVIRFAGRRVRPRRGGRATLVLRLRAGRYVARAAGATASVRVRPAPRFTG